MTPKKVYDGELTVFRKVYKTSELAEVNKLSVDRINRMVRKKFVYLLKYTATGFLCAHAAKTDFPKWCIDKTTIQ